MSIWLWGSAFWHLEYWFRSTGPARVTSEGPMRLLGFYFGAFYFKDLAR
jgi:hypothetical protein